MLKFLQNYANTSPDPGSLDIGASQWYSGFTILWQGETNMDNKTKSILTILAMLAVMGYTVWNYVSGRTTLTMFLMFMVILGIPMVNMINILIRDREK